MIDALLEQQKQNLTKLHAILEAELDCVRQRQPEKMLELVAERETILVAIQNTDKQLATCPELSEAKQQGSFKQRVVELEELLRQCRDLTAVNERVVKQGQIIGAKFRSVLMQQISKNSMTYDKKGKTRGSTSRGITKA